MAERKSLYKTTLGFNGLFSLQEIFTLTHDYFGTKGYDKVEKINEEIITENGKTVSIKLFPTKKTSDYSKNVIKIVILAKDVHDVVVEEDGIKKNMQKGPIKFSLEAYFETAYEGKSANKPFYFFLHEVFDRFVYKVYVGKAEEVLFNDTQQFVDILKAYFNLSHKGGEIPHHH